jgi:hypothetical protein
MVEPVQGKHQNEYDPKAEKVPQHVQQDNEGNGQASLDKGVNPPGAGPDEKTGRVKHKFDTLGSFDSQRRINSDRIEIRHR